MTVLALFASHKAEEANRSRTRAEQARTRAEAAEEAIRQQLYLANTNQAYLALDDGNVQLAIDLLDDHLPEPGESDLRRFEWYCLLRLCDHGPLGSRGRRGFPSPLTLGSHEDMVRSVAFSTDGKLVASAGWDKKLRLWNVTTLKEAIPLACEGRVAALTFVPGSKTDTLAYAVWDDNWSEKPRPSGQIILRDLTKNESRILSKIPGKFRWPLPGGVSSLAFSPDCKTLALGIGQFYRNLKDTDGTVVLLDVDQLKNADVNVDVAKLNARVMPVPNHLVLSLAFAPDSKTLVAGTWKKEQWGSAGQVKRWDATTGKELAPLEGHKGGVTCIAFSPDGTTLASSSWDHTVLVWDTATGKWKTTLRGHANKVWWLAFSPKAPEGHLLLASGSLDGTVKLWDLPAGEERATLRGHTASVYSLAFSPDGNRLATGSWDQTVKLWDINSELERASPMKHDDWVYCLAFSPDGKRLASAGVDNKVKLWDVDTRRELLLLEGHKAPITSVAFSPDGKTLASGSWDRTVKLWQLELGKGPRTLPHKGKVRPVVFAPDGKTLASGSEDGIVRLWDVATGGLVKTLQVKDIVNTLAFAADGKSLAVGTGDRYAHPAGRIQLWNLEKQEDTTHIKVPDPGGAVTALAFSPNGKLIVFWSARFVTHDPIPGELKLWDLTNEPRDPATEPSVKPFQQHIGGVSSIAFSPDGQTVASGAGDQTVKIWDVATGQECATLKGHTDRVMAVAFSPDGKTLATAGIDYTVRLWQKATHRDVIDFFERLAKQEPDVTNWKVDQVLAYWGYYLHSDRESANERAEARNALELGLRILKELRPDGLRLTEEKKETWIDAFERAIGEL